jgi:hypothetical protein
MREIERERERERNFLANERERHDQNFFKMFFFFFLISVYY